VRDGTPELDGVELVAGDAQREVGEGQEEAFELEHLAHI